MITGGNRGIGLGFARALAQAGASIALWGRDEGNNAKAEKEISALLAPKAQVKSFAVDVANEEEIVKAVQKVVEEYGRIDSVFANAGIGQGVRSFLELDSATYRKILSVNLDGVFWTLRETAKHMVARAEQGDEGGSLVVVGSLAAIEGTARNQHYAASKGGVISMMKACAVELARYGIRANAILPGWIATDMTEPAQQSQAFADKVIPRIPIRRWGEPKDFGGIAIYLASDASLYHSGDSFIIDGGYSIF